MMKWMSASHNGPLVNDNYEEKNRVSSYRGYLYKLRRSQNVLAPQWGKRWFSVEGHFLKWYRQESDLCSSGMIDLKYIRAITKQEAQGQYAFLIESDERNIMLRAATLTDMSNWIRMLHMHADIARGGSGTAVVSEFNKVQMKSAANIPSRSTPKRGGKTRASLSLEDEIEETLKKLNELENEVKQTPQPKEPQPDFEEEDPNAPPAKPTKSIESQQAKGTVPPRVKESNNNRYYEDSKDDSRSNNSRSDSRSRGENAKYNIPSEPVIETPKKAYNPPKEIMSVESTNSIEDISLVTRKPKNVRNGRYQPQNNQMNKNSRAIGTTNVLEDSPDVYPRAYSIDEEELSDGGYDASDRLQYSRPSNQRGNSNRASNSNARKVGNNKRFDSMDSIDMDDEPVIIRKSNEPPIRRSGEVNNYRSDSRNRTEDRNDTYRSDSRNRNEERNSYRSDSRNNNDDRNYSNVRNSKTLKSAWD